MSRKLDWEKANINERAIREQQEANNAGDRSPGPAKPERFNRLRYENRQWAVTDFGLEALVDGAARKFRVSVDELAEVTEGSRPAFKAPIELAEQSWVDVEALLDAFGHAVKFHYPQIKSVETEKCMQNTRRRVRMIAITHRR